MESKTVPTIGGRGLGFRVHRVYSGGIAFLLDLGLRKHICEHHACSYSLGFLRTDDVMYLLL